MTGCAGRAGSPAPAARRIVSAPPHAPRVRPPRGADRRPSRSAPRVRPACRRSPRSAQGVHPPRRAPHGPRPPPPRRRACTASASRSRGASASPSSARTARASRRSCACSRRCSCTTAAARSVFGIDVGARPRAVQRLVNRVSVEASFFKRMSPAENLSYSARFYGLTPRQTRTAIPAILRPGRLPARAPGRADGGPLPRHAAEDRARPRAAHLADPAPAGQADQPASTRAPSSRCRSWCATCAARTTARSCSARTTWPRPRRSPTGSGSCTRAPCSALDAPAEVRARYGAETLEDAFMAATGRSFEDEAQTEVTA